MTTRHPSGRTLYRALVLRARREGFAAIFAYPLLVTGFVTVAMGFAATHPDMANVPPIPPGGVFGLHVQDVRVALGLLLAPAVLVMGTCIGGGRCVQSLIGAQATSGEFETWLGSGLTLRDVVGAVLGLIATAVVAIWVVVSILVGAVLLWARAALDPAASLPALYWVMLLAVPLTLGLSGATLAVALAFARPRLLQPAERGMMHGTGNAVGSIAALPGIAVMVLFIFGASQGMSVLALIAAAAAVVVLLLVAGLVVALRFTSAEGFVSSL